MSQPQPLCNLFPVSDVDFLFGLEILFSIFILDWMHEMLIIRLYLYTERGGQVLIMAYLTYGSVFLCTFVENRKL